MIVGETWDGSRDSVTTYLPLHGEVTVTRGNTEEESVEVDEVIRKKDGVVWAWGCPHEL